jgi:hypothetical protein
MENLVTFKSNKSTFDIFFNGVEIANVLMCKSEVEILVDSINEFILDFTEGGNILEVKVDEENSGLIVDIWEDFRYDDIVDTAVFYFEDFCFN